MLIPMVVSKRKPSLAKNKEINRQKSSPPRASVVVLCHLYFKMLCCQERKYAYIALTLICTLQMLVLMVVHVAEFTSMTGRANNATASIFLSLSLWHMRRVNNNTDEIKIHNDKPVYSAQEVTLGIMTEDEYYKRDSHREKVSPYVHKFIIEGNGICTPKTEIAIIVLSTHDYTDRRNAIRETWGSAARTPYNPKGQDKISFAFIFGVHPDDIWNAKLKNESTKMKDIIQGDFKESYHNLVLKSLLCLKWMITKCQNAKVFIKSDHDMIINVPYLMSLIQTKNMKRGIVGHRTGRKKVGRKGKWAVSKDVFPYKYLPHYMSGTAYVISNDITRELFTTAEYVPTIYVEDLYITGILAKIIEARHVKVHRFLHKGIPGACDMLLNRSVAGTHMTTNTLRDLWQEMHTIKTSQCLR